MCITTQPVRNGVETLHVTARFSSAKAYPPTFHDVAQMWIGCLVILPSLQWLWLSPSMCGLWGSHKRFWSWQTGRETNVAWATNGTNPTCSFALLRTTQSACRCQSEGETFKFETWGFCYILLFYCGWTSLFGDPFQGDWALGLTWALRTLKDVVSYLCQHLSSRWGCGLPQESEPGDDHHEHHKNHCQLLWLHQGCQERRAAISTVSFAKCLSTLSFTTQLQWSTLPTTGAELPSTHLSTWTTGGSLGRDPMATWLCNLWPPAKGAKKITPDMAIAWWSENIWNAVPYFSF